MSDVAGVDAGIAAEASELAEDTETAVDDSGASVEPGRTDVGADSAGAVLVSVAG